MTNEQTDKFWLSGINRWVWTGCRHIGGYPTREAAEAAYALYPEYYDKATPRKRRKEIERQLDELSREW